VDVLETLPRIINFNQSRLSTGFESWMIIKRHKGNNWRFKFKGFNDKDENIDMDMASSRKKDEKVLQKKQCEK
jgi:hypothetical protein